VGGVLRAIYAALLPQRGACLVRATMRPVGDRVVLECGDPEDGVVALLDAGGHVVAEATPFHSGTTLTGPRRRRVDGIAGAGVTRAAAAARLLEEVVVVDHSPDILDRVLDLVTRLTVSAPVLVAAAERDLDAAR
jgi:hypothetical protein